MVTSLMDAYRTDADVIYPIPEYGIQGDYNYGEMTLSIHKQGGMSLGESGVGTWIVEVHHKGELIYSDESLTTNTPHTHLEAACLYAWFTAEGESGCEPFGERLAEWVGEYTNVSAEELSGCRLL